MLLVSLLIRLNNRLRGASMNLPGIVAYFPKTNYSRLIHLKVYYLFVLFAVTMLRQKWFATNIPAIPLFSPEKAY